MEPVRIVLEYDASTQCHRVIGENEGRGLFDAETAASVWGERRATREMVGLLNWLNRHGYSDTGLAEFHEVARSSVSRWRTGQNRPSNENLKALHELRSELGEKEGEPVNIPVNNQSTSRPNEFGRLPAPIEMNIDNIPPSDALRWPYSVFIAPSYLLD